MNNSSIATFAGGCFWCMVKPFDQWPGVEKVVVGYTGGHKENPTYEEVCSKNTGHIEAVEITYDESKISYNELLDIFFNSIDPTDNDGQFGDRGETYRTAVFFHNDAQKKETEDYIHNLESSGKFNKPIAVKLLPAKPFYPAEEEHQNYYKKNKLHYNLYFKGSGRKKFIEENNYINTFDKDKLKERLSDIEYKVTQEQGTEMPFQNAYNNHFEEGIYVDVVSGKPLFSSKDKFKCSCGWPAFAKPIIETALYEKLDLSHGMHRVEVRSTSADSHLGHIFEDGPRELGGRRYCINSASLKFIPKDKMNEEGYGNYLELL